MNRENEIINVRVDEIIPNRFQPRLAFNDTELKELSESIKTHGIIQPLVLRRIGDKYEIIAGERRYKASVMAGLPTVPAIIMNIDDKQSAEVAVVENLQRKDLTAIEEAQSYKKILDMGYLTQEELAARMGITQPTIANKLRLLNLSIPVKQALLNNQISERHARSLLALTDTNLQITMLNRIISERLTVRQTDEEINKLLGKTTNDSDSSVPSSPVVNLTPEKEQTPQIVEEPPKVDVPKNIEMLLRKEEPISPSVNEKPVNSPKPVENIPKEPTEEIAINPFHETNIETMNFEIPTTTEKPEEKEETNSIISEFRKQTYTNNTPDLPQDKNLSHAINVARDEVKKIENLGFEVDTEEFDFEDMYQIIIKIKKD